MLQREYKSYLPEYIVYTNDSIVRVVGPSHINPLEVAETFEDALGAVGRANRGNGATGSVRVVNGRHSWVEMAENGAQSGKHDGGSYVFSPPRRDVILISYMSGYRYVMPPASDLLCRVTSSFIESRGVAKLKL